MFGGICYGLAFCERRRAIAVNTGNIIECKIDVYNFRCKILRGYERRNDHIRAFGRADDVEEGAEFLCMSFSFVVIETVRVTPYWNETQFPPPSSRCSKSHQHLSKGYHYGFDVLLPTLA